MNTHLDIDLYLYFLVIPFSESGNIFNRLIFFVFFIFFVVQSHFRHSDKISDGPNVPNLI